MNNSKSAPLTISAVAFVAALIVDLYLIISSPKSIEIIIAISMIVIVDTYFMVEAIIAKVDDIASLNLDKQNELTKVEKGIYSVAKREELSRHQSMSALMDILIELKNENSKLYSDLLEQDRMLAKLSLKKESDNTTKIVNSNERLAVLIAQMATANSKSQEEALEIMNDICRELEEKNGKLEDDIEQTYSHLKVMK